MLNPVCLAGLIDALSVMVKQRVRRPAPEMHLSRYFLLKIQYLELVLIAMLPIASTQLLQPQFQHQNKCLCGVFYLHGVPGKVLLFPQGKASRDREVLPSCVSEAMQLTDVYVKLPGLIDMSVKLPSLQHVCKFA